MFEQRPLNLFCRRFERIHFSTLMDFDIRENFRWKQNRSQILSLFFLQSSSAIHCNFSTMSFIKEEMENNNNLDLHAIKVELNALVRVKSGFQSIFQAIYFVKQFISPLKWLELEWMKMCFFLSDFEILSWFGSDHSKHTASAFSDDKVLWLE